MNYKSATAAGLLVLLVVSLVVLAIETFLIMIIWNNVIIKKFPTQHIQPLSFWDALALSVFFALLAGAGSFISSSYSNKS